MKVKNNHLKYLLLSVIAVLLLTHGWYKIGFFPLTVFGFVPVFLLEHYIRKEQENRKLWIVVYGFLIFFGWNIASIWWVWNATSGGAIAAFFINSLPMILPLLLYSNKNAKNGFINKWFFISGWISLEMLQFYWDFAFPWLILGNSFALWPNLVQWYQITGVLGGSLYCLLFSFAIFNIITQFNNFNSYQKRNKLFLLFFYYAFTPVFLSYYILFEHNKKTTFTPYKADFIVVQPNIDPYGEKFGSLTPMMQLERMLALASTKISEKSSFIILPETALQGSLCENDIEKEPLIITIRNFLSQYPNIMGVLTGADTYRIFENNEKLSPTARKSTQYNVFYDSYNTALYISKNKPVQIYHKNKLVPGVEKMPYTAVFKFLENYAIGLGGTSGSLGSNGSSKVFYTQTGMGLAPIICYESAFASFTSSFVQKQADFLVVITNDGWWGNTPGYKQHFSFSALRAIENRRYIVRSANTGISGIIDHTGKTIIQTNWWQQEVFSVEIPALKTSTFYTRNGDLIGHFCIVYFMISLIGLLRKRKI